MRIKKVKASIPEKKSSVIKTKVDRPKLTLPTEEEEPLSSLSEAMLLIYGENKIGKTSLCSQFPDPLFLMFEPGGKGLKIKQRQVNSWREFVGYIDLLEKTEEFRNVVIDPIALCYKAVVDHVCEKELVNDPTDIGWGKGWKAIEDEFVRQIKRISASNRGIIFLGHPEQAEFEARTGGKYHKITPKMMKQAKTFIESFVDVIAFYGYHGDKRMLTIEGSDELDAGSRLKYQFRTPEGERIHSIPMFDKKNKQFDEEQAYKNLLRAFDNKQTDRCEPTAGVALTNTRAKRETKSKR